MGLADRNYMRPEGGRSARRTFTPGPRVGLGFGFSVTTWLIILCVAVFVIDGFLRPRMVLDHTRWASGVDVNDAAQMRDLRKRLTVGPMQERKALDQRGRAVVVGGERTLDDAGGRTIGIEVYRPEPFLHSLLYFSTSRALVHQAPDGSLRGFEFWRFIGFQFLHGSIWHLGFNMLGLFMFGPVVERTLGSKRYLAFYLLCGICGALFYLILNALGYYSVVAFGAKAAGLIPFLLINDPNTPLVGASAGVFGVLMAGAKLVPHEMVYIYGILPVRLDVMAYGLVIIALLTVFFRGSNAGGEAAHIGGAIAGFYFIRRTHHLHGFFNLLGRVDPTSRTRRARAGARWKPDDERIEVDRILAKLHEHGLQSLTAAERETLRHASERG